MATNRAATKKQAATPRRRAVSRGLKVANPIPAHVAQSPYLSPAQKKIFGRAAAKSSPKSASKSSSAKKATAAKKSAAKAPAKKAPTAKRLGRKQNGVRPTLVGEAAEVEA